MTPAAPVKTKDDAAAGSNEFVSDIIGYLKAGFPALYVTSWEERRVEQDFRAAVSDDALKRRLFAWSVTKGWWEITDKDQKQHRQINTAKTPVQALTAIAQMPDDAVFILRDYHFFLAAGDPEVNRTFRDMLIVAKASGRTLVLLSPITQVPVELEKDVHVVSYPLPTREQLDHVLQVVISGVGESKAKIGTNRPALLDAGRGLTWVEAENIYALAIVKNGSFNEQAITTVQREKANVLKKTGILEFHEPDIAFSEIAGHSDLKRWLQEREKGFSDEARAYGLPVARGVLLVGVQGCGKSAIAKAVAALWRRPLIRFDVGRVFGGLVGESERNMDRALALAEACAPCVLWLDELEKGMAGLKSSERSDGGVTKRVFGKFLTWQAEKKAPVFVIATCNDITSLPPEMYRKGRFDEIFFADLPTQDERAEIFSIHLTKRSRDPKKFDLAKLAMMADQYSGAEIEEAVISGMYSAFFTEQEVTTAHILDAMAKTKTLAETAAENVNALREWAKDRARPTVQHVSVSATGARRMRVDS